jgi:hypothetical protein
MNVLVKYYMKIEVFSAVLQSSCTHSDIDKVSLLANKSDPNRSSPSILCTALSHCLQFLCVVWILFDFSYERQNSHVDAPVGLRREIDVAVEAACVFIEAIF